MRTPRFLLGALGAATLIAGCDGNDRGNPVPVGPAVNPTATASASASPTPAPTPTAVSAPPGSSLQAFCALTGNSLASNQYPPVPGTYTILVDEGEVTGTSYVPVLGEYEPIFLVSPSPGPSLAPTPTPTPVGTASPSYVYYVYSGGYDVPAYVQTPGPTAAPGTAPLAVEATTGCFSFIQEVQPVPQPEPSQSPVNAFAEGIPYDVYDGNQGGDTVGSIGIVPVFGFTSFSPSAGGAGTFRLDNGVTGSFSVGGQQVFTEDELRRARKFFHNRFRKN